MRRARPTLVRKRLRLTHETNPSDRIHTVLLLGVAIAQPTGSDTCTNATPYFRAGVFNFNNQNVGRKGGLRHCGMSRTCGSAGPRLRAR
jgi:hypothetical protein